MLRLFVLGTPPGKGATMLSTLNNALNLAGQQPIEVEVVFKDTDRMLGMLTGFDEHGIVLSGREKLRTRLIPWTAIAVLELLA